MPETQAPTTPALITLADGEERTLRFSNGALKAIKKEFGVSVLKEGPQKLFEIVDEEHLSRLLVLGLDHKMGGKPGITEAEIDEILDAQNAPFACAQLFQALGASILKNALDLVLKAMENLQAPVQTPPPVIEPTAPPIPNPTPSTVM
jgi:hypothetical protein